MPQFATHYINAHPENGGPRFTLSIESDGDFDLQVRYRGKQQDFAVVKGKQKFELGL